MQTVWPFERTAIGGDLERGPQVPGRRCSYRAQSGRSRRATSIACTGKREPPRVDAEIVWRLVQAPHLTLSPHQRDEDHPGRGAALIPSQPPRRVYAHAGGSLAVKPRFQSSPSAIDSQRMRCQPEPPAIFRVWLGRRSVFLPLRLLS